MENIMKVMKNIIKSLLVMVALSVPFVSGAKTKSDPQGTLTYCLPSTVIALEVTAVQENFYAGPYARYAEKYLGIKARQADQTSFQITEIKMTPMVEPDQEHRYSVVLQNGQLDATFLKLSSAGLVSFADAVTDRPVNWRFPVAVYGDFSDKGVNSNLTSEAAVLYKKNKNESSFSKVSVQQDVIVAKTPEQKAAETAEMIVKLREHRLQLVTGDADAAYSGEALKAAIDELARLEKEYMSLFVGYTETQEQKKNFEVIPDGARETQKYIAFRISDVAGLVPADNLAGKPVIMELLPQEIAPVPELTEEQIKKMSKKAPVILAHYRIPAVCTVKVTAGPTELLQSRIAVYQLGQISSFPANVILK